MRKTYLLGISRDDELIFGEFERRENMFSALFFTVNPIIVNDDVLLERAENLIDSLGDSDKYHLCEYYDCSPSELANALYNHSSVDELIDISFYPESFNIEGLDGDIYFEWGAGGQINTRNIMKKYVNRELYDFLMDTWEENHLKAIDEVDYETLVNAYEEAYKEINEESFILDFLKEWIEG